jgi:hypothetical protein
LRKQVKIWFQNHRYKMKKAQKEKDKSERDTTQTSVCSPKRVTVPVLVKDGKPAYASSESGDSDDSTNLQNASSVQNGGSQQPSFLNRASAIGLSGNFDAVNGGGGPGTPNPLALMQRINTAAFGFSAQGQSAGNPQSYLGGISGFNAAAQNAALNMAVAAAMPTQDFSLRNNSFAATGAQAYSAPSFSAASANMNLNMNPYLLNGRAW